MVEHLPSKHKEIGKEEIKLHYRCHCMHVKKSKDLKKSEANVVAHSCNPSQGMI
jgi:hypothetical protein